MEGDAHRSPISRALGALARSVQGDPGAGAPQLEAGWGAPLDVSPDGGHNINRSQPQAHAGLPTCLKTPPKEHLRFQAV